MKYAAFISYRHGDIDEKVAKQVHRLLERYRIPRKIAKRIGKRSIGRVFRDSEELKAGSDLSALIKSALDETEWLIIVCTRRFQESDWCMEEVEYFLKIRGRERIIIILAEGEPAESFPRILTEYEKDGEMVKIEPLAVDIRDPNEKKIIKNIHSEKYRFLADMLDVDYDDLHQRERERRLRRGVTVAGMMILGIGAFAGSMMMKNMELESAYTALDYSMQQTLRGESYYLAEYAQAAYQNGDRKTAVKLGLEALPTDLGNPNRPFVSNAMRALTEALGVYDVSGGYQREQLLEEEEESYDTKVQISKDQKVILVEKYYSAANNILKRKATLYSVEDTKEIATYSLSDISRAFYANSTRGAILLSDSQTLVYTGTNGLISLDIYSGKKHFQGKPVSDLELSKQEDLIVGVDYEQGGMYTYQTDGKLLLECELGKDIEYALGDISPDSSVAALSASTVSASGILFVDTHTGENYFANQDGVCQEIVFTSNKTLCFLRTDRKAGLKHIVEYDLNQEKENYLCDANWNLQFISVSNRDTCFYYKGAKVYEVDQDTGNVVWKQKFSSDIISVMCGEDTVGISCKNGAVYFYDLKNKKQINYQAGNGEPFYFVYLDHSYAALRDYWGKMVRIYHQKEQNRSDVKKKKLFAMEDGIPDRWYTCASGSKNFIMGTQKGGKKQLWVLDSNTMEIENSIYMTDLGYGSFDNLTIEIADNGYFSVRDYATYVNRHFDISMMKKTLEYDDDAYYLYNENREKLFLAKDREVILYDAGTGKEQNRFSIPEKYNRGIAIGNREIYGNDHEICIKDKKTGRETVIENAELYTFHEGNSLLFYRNPEETEWFVYSLKKNTVVCKGKAGDYASTIFFGENRYFLNDYSEIYDMKTWKKVMDLSEISNGVYGVSTTDELPYFVVWYQDSDAKSTGKAEGSNTAYLYDKKNPEEIIGEIPNYVAATGDGEVVVYDGAENLYKIPLYSSEEILEMAKEFVGEPEFTNYQREKYHLYSK